MQVDKAYVTVPNWPTKDFQEARLSDPCTLKGAGMNSAQLKEFFFSFSMISFFVIRFLVFRERIRHFLERETQSKVVRSIFNPRFVETSWI